MMSHREPDSASAGVAAVCGPDTRTHRFVLIGRSFIDEDLLLAVLYQLDLGVHWLLYADDEAHTARRLLGQPFWLSLTRWERGLAGRCLSYLAATCAVPLQKVTRAGRYPNRYRVIGCEQFAGLIVLRR